jgi:hypothetical protein
VVVEVVEVVIAVLIIKVMLKEGRGVEVILEVIILMEVEEADHGIVMVLVVDVAEVRDMLVTTFRGVVPREWDLVGVQLLEMVVVGVVEKEELVRIHPMVEEQVVLVLTFQVMDLLSIIGNQVGVQVEQTGILKALQDLFKTVVMEILVAMVEVVGEHIVDHLMEMTGMV